MPSEVSQVQTAEVSPECKRARGSTGPYGFLGLVKLQRPSFRLIVRLKKGGGDIGKQALRVFSLGLKG